MLVLARRPQERIVIGENAEIVITLIEVRGESVRIGVTADPSIKVVRGELYDVVKQSKGRFQKPPDGSPKTTQ